MTSQHGVNNNPPKGVDTSLREHHRQKLVDILKELQLSSLAIQTNDISEWDNPIESLTGKLHWAEVQIEQWCQEIAREAVLRELERWATAKIDHRGESAPFNPKGLPISTSRTNEMTRLVNQAAKDRIAELTQQPPKYPNGRDEPCEICGDGGHTEIACPNIPHQLPEGGEQ